MCQRNSAFATSQDRQDIRDAITAIWNRADDALEAIREGRASWTMLARCIDAIAETAAEALQDEVPCSNILPLPSFCSDRPRAS